MNIGCPLLAVPCTSVCFVCWKCRLEIRVKLGEIDRGEMGWWVMLFELYVLCR